MRSLKRPLSILIAALMLVSIMVIAPVTANATTETHNVEKWVKGQLRENSALYKFPDLFENFKFVRMTKNAEPSWSNVVDENQTADLSLTGKGNTDTFQLQSWSGHTMNGTWFDYNNVTDGIYIDAAHDGITDFDHTAVDWYAWTWETLTLTSHDAVYGDNGNIEYYTDTLDDGRYFLKNDDTFDEVERKDIFFDYVTVNNEGFNYASETFTPEVADPLKDNLGGLTSLRNLQTVGVQTNVNRSEPGFRFLTVVKSDILSAADDYGYVVVKTTSAVNTAMTNASRLTVSDGTKYSCAGTSNDFADVYGNSNLSDSNYKYLSCFVKGASSGQAVACRFYVKFGDDYIYSQYTSDNSTWYDGCAYALS